MILMKILPSRLMWRNWLMLVTSFSFGIKIPPALHQAVGISWFPLRNSSCVEHFGNSFSETMLWNMCNQANGWAQRHGRGDVWPGSYKSTWGWYTGSFCHSVKCSVCVCLFYRCLSRSWTIKPCQNSKSNKGGDKSNVYSSLGCVLIPALIISRAGIHTAFVLFAWQRSTLSQLSRQLTVRIASASRCGCFTPVGLSLKRELSAAFLGIAVVGIAGGSRGGNGDGQVPFCFLCRRMQRHLPGFRSTLWQSSFFPPGRELCAQTVAFWRGRRRERRWTTLVCTVYDELVKVRTHAVAKLTLWGLRLFCLLSLFLLLITYYWPTCNFYFATITCDQDGCTCLHLKQ